MKNICLGSKSPTKTLALQGALEIVSNPQCEVIGIKTKTDFPEQPEGEETYAACAQRLSQAAAANPGGHAMAAESGLFLEDGQYVDRAVVALRTPAGVDHYHVSDSVVLPTNAVEEARRRGFDTTTVGMVLAETIGGKHYDPHWTLTGGHRYGRVARHHLLTITMAELLMTAMADSPDGETVRLEKTHHVVRISPSHSEPSIYRALPILEVGEGKRLALFDLLGDHELCEAAGKGLMNHAFSSEYGRLKLRNVDAFVMPDGKAQALLHVIGRCAQRPTVVARKTIKPYMRDVISVNVKSITDVMQQLHLSGKDVLALRGKRVVIVDDVVSSGGTLGAMRALLEKIGAAEVGIMAVFTEGDPREDVISLGHFPLF